MIAWGRKAEDVKMTADAIKHSARLVSIDIFFDDTSTHYRVDPQINMMFVRAVVDHMRQLHRIKGVVFLNELLEGLGLPRLQAGQTAGWYRTPIDIVISEFNNAIVLTCWLEIDAHHALD